MKDIVRKWLAIAMVIALVFGCALAEVDVEALFDEGKEAYDAGDYATALEKLTEAAEHNVTAQVLLGNMYRYGYGVEADFEKAVECYQSAADSGYADGKAELGSMYESGRGVEQDTERALALYNEATEGGSDRGRTLLGEAYIMGESVEQDVEKGMSLIQESMDNGYADAKALMGLLYVGGIGVAQDQEYGLQLLLEAASEGSMDAKVILMAAAGINYDAADAPDAVLPAEANSAAESVTEITDKDQIKSAQGLLNILGYDCGTPDGVAGKKTQAAVTKFQQDNGLTVTGTITDEVQEALLSMVSISSAP